jgi:cysteinyl-tRNA synthetase
MALALYNTLTRSREPFEPLNPDRVTMYVCGPTVYSYAHIGNARPYVVFDVLARLLRRSYPLVYARNITDVDDKINAAARQEGVTIGTLTARYASIFHEDMETLGVLPPDVEPRVTEHIPQIVAFIERLLEGGNAYEADGHVLFAVDSFRPYGQLSGRSRDEMIAGARVEIAPYKRDPGDFVLWKPAGDDGIGWQSPWGHGRPGWHIECSTMVAEHLGDSIDIHGGGLDLVFPHHENEIAQSTCAHGGARFCRYWIHNGLVNVDSEKMSKSIGNVLLIHSLLERYPGEVVRLALLTAHYRQPLDWTEQLLADARQKLDRMYGALRAAGIDGEQLEPPDDAPADGVVAALEDDLNTPRALAELFELVRAANRSADPTARAATSRALRAGAWLLGLLGSDPVEWFEGWYAPSDEIALSETEIEALLEEREVFRSQRNFAEADRIRERLSSLGIVLEDGIGGSRWRRAR